MTQKKYDIVVLYENQPWQEPLFAALSARGISFRAYDLKNALLDDCEEPESQLYFNQASPSAYTRSQGAAVPFALEYIEFLEEKGVRVLNGSRAFRFELSKAAQIRRLRQVGIDAPRSVTFNSLEALRERRGELSFPCILKPNQGGSGARMYKIQGFEELERLLEATPGIWEPDPIFLLQELLEPKNPSEGIVRIEFLGGNFLYALRVVSHGSFNLCPSEICNPTDSSDVPALTCAVDSSSESEKPEFYRFLEVPEEAVATGKRIVQVGHLDVGAVEYLETVDGRRVFFDINANSNLRRPIGEAFGFDPFERVVDFLAGEIERSHTTQTGEMLSRGRI